MSISALERLGASQAEELLNAIISLPSNQHSYSKVIRVDDFLVQTLAGEIPISELVDLCPLSSQNASLPWANLLTLEDLSRYSQSLQNYSESLSPFLQAQFYHIMLPSLDVYYTSHLLSSPSIETTIDYFSNLKNFIQTWLLMSADVMSKYEVTSALTFARVITESRHIVFHLVKKLLSIARKASYANGYKINVGVNKRKHEHNPDFSFDALVFELKAPLLKFISTEDMSWPILGEFLDQFLLLLPSNYQDVTDLAILRLFTYLRDDPKASPNQSILNVLIQIYKTFNQTTKRETLSLALCTATQLLTSGSVQTKRAAVVSLISLLQYNELDPTQADAIYQQYPFALIIQKSADLDAGLKLFLLDVLTEGASVKRFLTHNHEYPRLLHELVSLESIDHFMDHKRWTNLDTLLEINGSFLWTDSDEIHRIVSKALLRSIPVRLLPLFAAFPIQLLDTLYDYYQGLRDEKILTYLCQCTTNRFCLVRQILTKESHFPAWAKFARTSEKNRTQRFLMWAWSKTETRLKACPRWVIFEVANQYI